MTDIIMMGLSRWRNELEKQELRYEGNILFENPNYNENWHSRVLKILFEYHEGENFPVLDSFIDLMKRKGNFQWLRKPSEWGYGIGQYIERIDKVTCSNEKYRIDLLVEIGIHSAIIIENKINWATDQDRQIVTMFAVENTKQPIGDSP